MAAKNTLNHSIGLFIPLEQKNLFLSKFERTLIGTYNVVPVCVPTMDKHVCEVKLNYLGRNRALTSLTYLKAKEFLFKHIQVAKVDTVRNRRKSPKIDGKVWTIDLTKEPEIITLDGSLEPKRQKIQNNITSDVDVVDLVNTPNSSIKRGKSPDKEIEILSIKKLKKPTFSLSPSRAGNFNSKKQKGKSGGISVTLPNKGLRSVNITKGRGLSPKQSMVSPSSTNLSMKKRRKLQGMSYKSFMPTSSKSPSTRPLSDNILKYYETVNKFIAKVQNKSKRKRAKPVSPGGQPVKNAKKGSKMNQVTCSEGTSTGPILNNTPSQAPQKPFIQFPFNSRGYVGESNMYLCNPIPSIEGSNIYNPNPYVVDSEGLRPIVIDGSNLAIGHGRGTFSARGIQICVDYFSRRGHSIIKVFLPRHRQEHFSEEMMQELKTKCDIVLTPSQCINGYTRTSYDDRFILQYAALFGGVVVSTDNFRDLWLENPSWHETISKRLLMFTWVDDFLMFPVDPLGKTGPNLEEFLRF